MAEFRFWSLFQESKGQASPFQAMAESSAVMIPASRAIRELKIL